MNSASYHHLFININDGFSKKVILKIDGLNLIVTVLMAEILLYPVTLISTQIAFFFRATFMSERSILYCRMLIRSEQILG